MPSYFMTAALFAQHMSSSLPVLCTFRMFMYSRIRAPTANDVTSKGEQTYYITYHREMEISHPV